jgi:hypothetical protein
MKSILFFLSGLFSVIFVLPATAGGADESNSDSGLQENWVLIFIFLCVSYLVYLIVDYSLKEKAREQKLREEFDEYDSRHSRPSVYTHYVQTGENVSDSRNQAYTWNNLNQDSAQIPDSDNAPSQENCDSQNSDTPSSPDNNYCPPSQEGNNWD